VAASEESAGHLEAKPDPADGGSAAACLCSAGFGDTAIFHNVYRTSVDRNDLVAANQPFAMYYHVAGVEPGVTYYWRRWSMPPAGRPAMFGLSTSHKSRQPSPP
jgi:hypothetical protein